MSQAAVKKKVSTSDNPANRLDALKRMDTVADYESLTEQDSVSGDLFNEKEIAELEQKHRSIGSALSIRWLF